MSRKSHFFSTAVNPTSQPTILMHQCSNVSFHSSAHYMSSEDDDDSKEH